MFSHLIFCNHLFSYLCTLLPPDHSQGLQGDRVLKKKKKIAFLWLFSLILFQLISSKVKEDRGQVEQIIYIFAQCLFHICWEPNSYLLWNKFIFSWETDPIKPPLCFDVYNVHCACRREVLLSLDQTRGMKFAFKSQLPIRAFSQRNWQCKSCLNSLGIIKRDIAKGKSGWKNIFFVVKSIKISYQDVLTYRHESYQHLFSWWWLLRSICF